MKPSSYVPVKMEEYAINSETMSHVIVQNLSMGLIANSNLTVLVKIMGFVFRQIVLKLMLQIISDANVPNHFLEEIVKISSFAHVKTEVLVTSSVIITHVPVLNFTAEIIARIFSSARKNLGM